MRSLPRKVAFGIATRQVRGRILRQFRAQPGYLMVSLSRPAPWRVVRRRVHRLVAPAFLGKPPRGRKHVNHKDSNKRNNVPANLEWCNQRENNRHMYRNGRGNTVMTRLTSADLVAIRAAKGRTYSALAAEFGVSAGTIYNILHRKNGVFK